MEGFYHQGALIAGTGICGDGREVPKEAKRLKRRKVRAEIGKEGN